MMYELKEKGIALCATEQPVHTGTAAGKAFLNMLGVSAEFETGLRSRRWRVFWSGRTATSVALHG